MAIEKLKQYTPLSTEAKNIASNKYNPMAPELFGKPKSFKGETVEFAADDKRPMLDAVPDDPLAGPDEEGHYDNLVEYLDEKVTLKIGKQCLDWFEKDLESRSRWEETITKGIDNLGIDIKNNDEPFEGACGATHPLILETAVKFQSKATAELLPASGPVRTQVLGVETEEALNKANRVKQFMNYQVTRLMPEYYPDMEKLLFYLPLYGSAFKKTYWDFQLDRPVSCFIEPENFVISDKAKSITKARRYSEILPPISGSELHRKVTDQEFIYPKEWRTQLGNNLNMNSTSDYDITGDANVPSGGGIVFQTNIGAQVQKSSGQMFIEGQYDKIFTLIEQHCHLSLPSPLGEIGYTDPFIVTFVKETGEVLSIRRNWKEDDINKKKRVWYSHYSYVPGFGFYGLGLFHLLGNFQVTLTSVVRSLVDAGQFANLQGGLKLKGLRIIGDNSAIAPGEWKEVESATQDISKALFPLPYKEPSQVLFALLQWLDGRAGAFADSTEQVIGDSTNYGPVGTTVALLEASMKLFSAIHKRTHLSQEQDLKLLAEINFEYMPDEYPYDVPGEERSIFRQDFDPHSVNVIPVSNPNVTSNAHRMAVAQTKLQAAMQAPQIHNMKKVFRDFYLALGEEDIDKLIPPDVQAQPLSPLEDILAITQGKPIKGFPGQDHKSHAMFKSTWLKDKVVGGASPTMAQFVPSIQANIVEHQILQFQEQIEGMVKKTGAATDPSTLAQVQAQAAQEVQRANDALASTFGNDDPLHMVAQAELMKAQTERDRVAHVKTKDLAQLALNAQKLDIDALLARIKGKEVNANIELKQFQEGLKAVQQGIENLMQEDQRDATKEQAKQQMVKTQGLAQKNMLDAQSTQTQNALKAQGIQQKNVLGAAANVQKMAGQENMHKQKLAHQKQMHNIKQSLAQQVSPKVQGK